MPQPMQFNDLVNLVNGTIVENSTQDVTATLVNQALLRILEYSDNHSINDDRISSNIARMASVLSQIETAKDDIEGNLQPGEPDTLKDLLDYLNNEVSQLNTAIAALSNGAPPPDPVPSGVICMWSGDGTVLPVGWALCDGSNGTPDLRGRFVVGYHSGNSSYDQPGNLSVLKYNGSGGTEIPGEIGGTPSNTLSKSNIPRHYHEAKGDGATINIGSSGSHSHSTNGARKVLTDNVSVKNPLDNKNSVVDYSSSTAVANAVSHSHSNSNFAGRVGHGGSDGLPSSPSSIENRPPYYTLAYIMKL